MIAAMQKADSTDPAKYLPELQKISYNGATGKIEFDEKGDRKNAEITIFTMKDGKVEPIASRQGRQDVDVRGVHEGDGGGGRRGGTRRRRRRRRPRPRTRRRSKRRRSDENGVPRGAVFFARRSARDVPRAVRRVGSDRGDEQARIAGCGRRTCGNEQSSRDVDAVREDRLDIFLQQLINGLTLGSVYAVVALGYTMVYGIIQLINFAHGEVVMIGAMVAFSVITALAGAHRPAAAR